MIADWKTVSPALFEKLCASVLKHIGFTNIQWYGEVGSDKGRDIIAEKRDVPVPGVERRERWMVQCRRYTEARLSKSELKDLLDAALEHDVDSVLIIVTSPVSANLRDWLSTAKTRYPFKAYVWEELDFRKQVTALKEELLDALPELMEGKEPVWMYPMQDREVRFGCNEFEEVEVVVSNAQNVEDAKKAATEFLQYVKSNGFDWWK